VAPQPSIISPQTSSGPVVSGPVVRKWLRRLRSVVLWSCGLAVLVAFCFVFRAPLLAGLANAWIVNEPLTRADAVVVLGGGLETRPFEVARIYHQGLAPKILVMNPKPSRRVGLGATPSQTELTRQILAKLNVPESDLLVVGGVVTSTYDESIAVRDWIRTSGAKRVIIPTDSFHTRRVRWLFRKELKPTGAQVIVDAIPGLEYTAEDWWHREEGVIAFQNEVIKYLYYRIKY
jgi:uncharacterized SAM-binding protein YcdF (DUF218 family)